MHFALTGLSHHSAPLALRERMAISPEHVPEALKDLKNQLGRDSGVAILSTCNRIEVYACADMEPKILCEKILSFLASLKGMDENEFTEFLYHHHDAHAIEHLFKVAASLDSMVVGENEIMCQVNRSHELAQKAKTLNRMLHALFQRALKCGKRVRTETNIATGSVSVASLLIELAGAVLKDFENKTVMIVGSGRISELALKGIVDRGVTRVMVSNRTLENARSLATQYRGEAFLLEALPCHLHRADIVISSTGAPDPILFTADFRRAIRQREGRPMFAIDAAVPRDIEREVSQIDNVYYYDLEDLQHNSSLNLQKRMDEVYACEKIVQDEVQSFQDWVGRLRMEPLILGVTNHYHKIREQELQRTLSKLNGSGEAVRHEIECLSRRIVNRLLRNQIESIKEKSFSLDEAAFAKWVQDFIGFE